MKTVSKLSLLLFLSLSSPLIGQEENPFRPRIEAPEFLERLRSLAPSLEGVQKKADDPAWPPVGVRVGSGYRKGNAYLGGIEPRSIIKQRGDRFNVEYTSENIPHNIHYYLKANLKATGGLQEGYQTRFLLLLANLYEDPHDIPRREKYSMAADDLDRRVLFCKLDPYYSYTRIETTGSSLPGIEQTYHNVDFLPYVKNPELSDRMQKIFDSSNGRLSRETGPITVDMIRYGCEVGVYVNGLCVLHLPTEPDSTRAVDFNMHTTAIEIDSEEQNMWEITD